MSSSMPRMLMQLLKRTGTTSLLQHKLQLPTTYRVSISRYCNSLFHYLHRSPIIPVSFCTTMFHHFNRCTATATLMSIPLVNLLHSILSVIQENCRHN